MKPECGGLVPLLAAAAVSVAACAHGPIAFRAELVPAEPAAGEPLGPPVVLVSQTRFRHSFGRTGWAKGEVLAGRFGADWRPVQLAMYGQALVGWALDRAPPARPVVHLGDVGDLSCRQEFASFVQLMKARAGQARRAWVVVPGNHDGYFDGNWDEEDETAWREACRDLDGGGGPMNKAQFVDDYLRAVSDQDDPGARALFAALEKAKWPRRGSFRAPEGRATFLKAAVWSIDEAQPWRSYVVQEVDLAGPGARARVVGILLDSASYSERPVSGVGLVRDADQRGDLPAAEVDLVESWIATASSSGAAVILFAHHPYAELSPNGRAAVDRLLLKGRVATLVSSGARRAAWITHGRESGADGWVELSAGPALDWPPQVALLSLSEAKGRLAVGVAEVALEPAKAGLACAPEWRATSADGDPYVGRLLFKGTPEEIDRRAMDVMLNAYVRLLKVAGTAHVNEEWPTCCRNDGDLVAAIEAALRSRAVEPKKMLLSSLDAFEEKRQVVASSRQAHEAFRVCQALFALERARAGSPAPPPERRAASIPLK